MEERACWAALAALPGLGPRAFARLVAEAGSAEAAWSLPGRELARRAGLRGPAADRLAARKRALVPARLVDAAARLGAGWRTWNDPDYPAGLRDLDEPPPVIYFLGRLPAEGRAAGIVGTRAADGEGLRVAEALARDLASDGVVVVSGLARGIDGAAHRGALRAGGFTVAVLGAGLDRVYPPEHRDLFERVAETGGVLTEYPPGTDPAKEHFPWRNRLIAALSQVVVVVQADLRSGALITADYAAELGREVLAVPGDVGKARSAGTNRLIAEGAHPALDAEDVLVALEWTGSWRALPALDALREGDREGAGNTMPTRGELPSGALFSDAERRVFACLSPDAPLTIDGVAQAAGLPLGTVMAALLVLEVEGLARQIPGAAYIRVGPPHRR